MTAARDHIRKVEEQLELRDVPPNRAVVHALLAIACTLADMADQEADTKPQHIVPDFSGGTYVAGDTFAASSRTVELGPPPVDRRDR